MPIPALIAQTAAYEATGPYVDGLGAGLALTGYRTAATAYTAGDLTDGQAVLVTIYQTADYSNFLIWSATYDQSGGRFARVSELVDAGTISDEDGVDIFVSHTGNIREFYVDAAAMVPRATNGAAVASEEYATNDVMSDHYLFDSITEEGVQFKLTMPDAWNRGTIKARFFWDAATGASASDGVTWGLAARAASNDDAIDTAFSASVDTDDTVIAVGDLHVSAASAAVTVSGTPALGDMVWFEITRVVSDTNDDMAEDAKLLGIQVQYTESPAAVSGW